MEKNYKTKQIGRKWYIEYEYYNHYEDVWKKRLVKDRLNQNLGFRRESDADDWVKSENLSKHCQ